MIKILDELSSVNVRKNDGYIFVKKEEVFVPIIKVILSVTKRSFYSLPLLDEVVLRLINEDVCEIDEIVNILGVNRKLLEVTLADLNVKDIIYCSSNRCKLLAKGKEALKELRTIQRQKDTIKNIYLDPINHKVIEDYEKYQYIDRVNSYDKKLDANFEVDNTEIFKENFDSVNKVFLDEMNIYNDKTKVASDELLSIDDVESVYVKFVRLPIFIYVSAGGLDIDILAVNKQNDTLLSQFKGEIIEQIRTRRILKNTFVKYKPRKNFSKNDLLENKKLSNVIVDYKRNKKDKDELAELFENEIFTERKLFDGEFEILFRYLVENSEQVKIEAFHLDDWVKSELIHEVLSVIGSKKLAGIKYADCYDFNKAICKLQQILPDCSKNKVIKCNVDCYFSLEFDDKYIITGIPKEIAVLDANTYIHKLEFYFQCL